MNITCAYHVDRTALAYCAGCGKPLCGQCVVRLSMGNYCDACAAAPDHRPGQPVKRSRTAWWIVGAVIVMVVYVLSRLIL
jgi:B-box zinc finger protein